MESGSQLERFGRICLGSLSGMFVFYPVLSRGWYWAWSGLICGRDIHLLLFLAVLRGGEYPGPSGKRRITRGGVMDPSRSGSAFWQMDIPSAIWGCVGVDVLINIAGRVYA